MIITKEVPPQGAFWEVNLQVPLHKLDFGMNVETKLLIGKKKTGYLHKSVI